MKILAFDTSMAACSAAVSGGGRVLAQRHEAMATGQAERLAPMIDEIMKEAGLAFRQLDRIAVTTGPGTFTGVRIGLAMARGFGVSLGIPAVGINSLAAIAINEPSRDIPLVVAADARNNEVYLAVFDDAVEPRIVRREDLGAHLPHDPFRLLGSGADTIIGDFPQAQRSAAGDVPSAQNFIRIAARLAPPDHPPDPLYLRQPDIKPQHRIETLTDLNAVSAALLAELHGECFSAGWREDEFAKLFAAPGMFASIITHQNEPAGFALVRRAADEAEIITICVRPALRRKGFGKMLLAHAERSLREQKAASLFLEVNASNEAARALYRRLGFTEAGRRPRYYRGTEDAIIMRKGL
jgi:tRNA threonylcarbamoyl adenosine modification protein YeaZ/ribosomal-protein-alanine acetyltransferase